MKWGSRDVSIPIEVRPNHMNRRLSSRLLAAILFFIAGASAQQPNLSASAESHEETQACLGALWGKPVFWDQSAVVPVDSSVCKAKPEDVEQALKQQHILVFHLSNAALLTSETKFDKNNTPFSYLWRTPVITIRVLPRVTPGSRRPTDDEVKEFAEIILKRSHMPPLTCPFKPSEGQIAHLAFNVFIEIHKMHPGSEQESVIALLADSDPDHETVLGTGRLVYGELEHGRLSIRWESPLLESAMSQLGFADLLGDGSLQIMLTSVFGMGNHTAFYAFDLDGHEISRQSSTCEAFSELAAQSVAACPISTESDIKITGNANGPKELLATSESGKRVRYVVKNMHFEEAQGPKLPKPPSIPQATAVNAEGMKLMQQGDYQSAVAKFEEAAQLNERDPLFANNAGFAYYKLGRNQDSLYWFNKAIEIDPNRAIAYLNLGDAYGKLNNYAQARRAYEKYLELAPESKSASEVKKKLDALTP